MNPRPPWAEWAPWLTWLPVSASGLFVIAFLLFRSLGIAVGITSVYLGAGLLLRLRREPPDLLKVVDPASERLQPYRQPKSSAAPWPWQVASVVVGIGLIAFGVTLIILARGS
jgi:hypothetical protein